MQTLSSKMLINKNCCKNNMILGMIKHARQWGKVSSFLYLSLKKDEILTYTRTMYIQSIDKNKSCVIYPCTFQPLFGIKGIHLTTLISVHTYMDPYLDK